MKYIWELKGWPRLCWRSSDLIKLLGEARLEQGKLLSSVAGLGFKLKDEAGANVLVEEVIKNSAIEGEKLNLEQVRSSVAKHLGLPAVGLTPASQKVDGAVEVLLDATKNYSKALTVSRIKRWQAALFPTGQSGLRKVRTGKWRSPDSPMQVVSGAIGREKIHYEAPPGKKISKEIECFLDWWNKSLKNMDGILRSGMAHFYFVTIHPFEDGNGRIARALVDMALAQDEKSPARYYSLSSQIMEERNSYYKILESSQKGELDITSWLKWYLDCYIRAINRSKKLMVTVMAKAEFWKKHSDKVVNLRQKKVVNRLLDSGPGGFEGGLTTRKYVSMTKTSRATAFREISDLCTKKILKQNPSKGRSVNYDLRW